MDKIQINVDNGGKSDRDSDGLNIHSYIYIHIYNT